MAEETIISFNATNWVTVVLMVGVGFAILGAVSKYVRSRSTSNAGN